MSTSLFSNEKLIRLDPGGRRSERSRVYSRGKRIKSAYKTREQRGIDIIGSWGEPMGKVGRSR